MGAIMRMAVPPSALPDPERSRAVLVGTASYDSLEQLPAVASNLAGLRDALTDPELWGLPERHCRLLLDPPDAPTVLDAIRVAATEATDAIVVYLTGHGLPIGASTELYLALKGSDGERPYLALRYDDVRHEMLRAVSMRKVVILDSCYSGIALKGHMTGTIEIADSAGIEGTYLMTATNATSTAWAPPGEAYTAFSGVLIDRLRNGVPNGPELLDMETLYYNVRDVLVHRGLPTPQQRVGNDGSMIALARNRAFEEPARETGEVEDRALAPGRPPETVPPVPDVPEWTLPLVAAAPARVLRHVDDLRHDGRAEELLSAIGRRRDPQGLVAIADRFRSAGDADSMAKIVGAAARRPAADVLDLVATCRALDRPAMALAVLERAGGAATGPVAALVQLLVGAGAADDLRRVLDAALTAAQRANSVLDLVGALWAAGLRDEVDRMLQRGTARLSGEQTLDIADELRSAGRDQFAFTLYRLAAPELAERGPDAVARVVRAMEQAGRSVDAQHVAGTAIETRLTAVSLVELAMALTAAVAAAARPARPSFWRRLTDQPPRPPGADQRPAAVDQQATTRQALTRAARMPSDEDVLDAAALLVSAGDEPAALEFCRAAIAGRPADRLLAFIEALRDRGRPLDARTLLLGAASELSAAKLVALAREADDADRALIIGHVLRRNQRILPEVIRHALGGNAPDVVDTTVGHLLARPSNEILAALSDLSATLTRWEAEAALERALRAIVGGDGGDRGPVGYLRDRAVLGWMLDRLAALPPDDVRPWVRPVLDLLDVGTLTAVTRLLDERPLPLALHELAMEAVDALSRLPGLQPLLALLELIWRDSALGRRAAWGIAVSSRMRELEAALEAGAVVPDQDVSVRHYDWLWEPFGGSSSLRVIAGRIGYLIDTTSDADVPAGVRGVDPRIALGLAACSWNFRSVDLGGSRAAERVRAFVRGTSGRRSPAELMARIWGEPVAEKLRGGEVRTAALQILTMGGVPRRYVSLLDSLSTAALTGTVRQLDAGWNPRQTALSDWRSMGTVPEPVPSGVRDALVLVAVAAGIGLTAVGLLRLLGTIFGFWGGLPIGVVILMIGALLVTAFGIGATKLAERDDAGLSALGGSASVLTVGGAGLFAVANWTGWWTILGVVVALGTAIALAANSVTRRTRALANACSVILERRWD